MSTPPPTDQVPGPDDDELSFPSEPVFAVPPPERERPDGGPPGYATEVVHVDDDDS